MQIYQALKKLTRLLLTLTIATTAACNSFHLRGSLEIPSYLKKIYITPNEPYEPLQAELRRRLQEHNVIIVSNPEKGVSMLDVSRPSTNEQVLAYGSSGEVQRFKLSLAVTYSFIPNETDVDRIHRTITRSRELNRTNNMLLSNEGEIQIVKRDLLNEAVSELLRQITTRPHHKEAVPCSSTTNDNPC